jgi:hypothetical protein
VSTNWVRFTDGTDFAGLYGRVNEEGNMSTLGFVERDSVCAESFLKKLGKDNYDWFAQVDGAFETPDTFPKEY